MRPFIELKLTVLARVINEALIYEEAIDRCQELGDFKLAITTNRDELLFVHHFVLGQEKVKFWLQLR